MCPRDWRFVKIDNFNTNLAQLTGEDVCSQYTGVYSRTVTVELKVTDSEGSTTELVWLRVETK